MTYGPDLGQQPIPGVHRTPDEQFATVDDFPFAPHYLDIDGLRMHYIDEGSGAAGTFILLHGEPVWSYMYRDAIRPLAAAGYRVIAPDNIGFGKSDKVIDVDWYTLDHHVLTLKTLVTRLDLRGITIVVNDWGGPNGLIMATEMPDRLRPPDHPQHLAAPRRLRLHRCPAPVERSIAVPPISRRASSPARRSRRPRN